MMGFKSFFTELKRRNIYKVAVTYAITGWIVIQIASVAANTFGAPAWVMKMIITAVLLGFPIAIIITWAFEVTPEGIQRTPSETKGDSESKPANDRYFWIGIIATIVFLFGGWRIFNLSESENQTTGRLQKINDQSIAILPLANISGTKEARPLARGLHEDLLTRLANISDLQVTSRTSVEKYRESNLTLPDIADSLGVRWVMEGGVSRIRDQVRINAELIDPQTDAHIWADTYQRELTANNIFAIQGDIAREIAGALQAQLSAGEQERIVGAPTNDLKAYRLYIEGRNLLDRRTPESIHEAISYFEKAIQQDSSYALAWSGLSDARILSAWYGANSFETAARKVKATMPNAVTAATQALKLEPDLAEAHASRGLLHFYNQLFWSNSKSGPKALKKLQRAVELKPSYPEAHHWLGEVNLRMGRPQTALKHIDLAVKLNPENYSLRRIYILALISNGDYKTALFQSRQLRHRYPKRNTLEFEALAHLHLKNWSQVYALTQQYDGETQYVLGWDIAYSSLADVAVGDTSSVRRRLNQPSTDIETRVSAVIQAAQGEFDPSFAYFKKSIEEGVVRPYFQIQLRFFYPDLWRSFRADPRYDAIIEKINQQWGLNADGSIPGENN